MKTNSQILLSPKLYLGDIDGDSLNELIEVDGRHIYIFKCEYNHKPLLEYVLPSPIKRVIVGDFDHNLGVKQQQILFILEDGSLRGYGISTDLKELWWWFTQSNFISSNEHYIVGDFDGDGADEIMVYNPRNGSLKIFKKAIDQVFKEMTNYSIGNLAGYDLRQKLIIAGNFSGKRLGDDLLMVNKVNGQVSRFSSVTDKNGIKTFWWVFTSKTGRFLNNDEVVVANIDGSRRDGLLIRKRNSGNYIMYKLEYNNGNLVLLNDIDAGQLPIKPNTGCIIASKVRDKSFRRERGGTRRDDILYFNPRNGQFIRTDARFDRSKQNLTYWWAYSSGLVCEPQKKPQKKPWAVILCRFKGQSANNQIKNYFEKMFSPGSGGMIEYWHDVSLGAIDVSGSKVFGWVELNLLRRNAGGLGRRALIDSAILACRRENIDAESGFHSQIAVFMDNWSVDKHPSTGETPPMGMDWDNRAMVDKWKSYWLDGSSDGKRVSAPLHGHSGSFIAHEMGHGMNFEHDLYPDLSNHYGDPTCIMSAMNIRGFNHPVFKTTFGPSLSFPQLHIKDFMYKRRVHNVNKSWVGDSNGVTFNLASINDRRVNAYLGVILPVDQLGSWDYYLEYMRPDGWNKGLENSVLVIRRVLGNTAAYLGEVILPSTLKAKKGWTEPSGKVRFEIEKIQSDERIISVNVIKK